MSKSSYQQWEEKLLTKPGARERVDKLANDLRVVCWLVSLREAAGLSQRGLAKRMNVSQPRIAAMEKCQNLSIESIQNYVTACGGELRLVAVRQDGKKKSVKLAA